LAIRLAGFEIRDQLAWVYGSGFRKSRNVWENDLKEEFETALRNAGVEGEINWK